MAGELVLLYQKEIKLAGIIYLHRITDIRMTGSSLRNLSMFKKLCGGDYYNQVVLATTMWRNLPSQKTGYERESELLERKEWWGMMAQRGSKTVRHTGDRDSAVGIINTVMMNKDRAFLDIQRELVDQKKALTDTSAGIEVEKEIGKAKMRYKQQLDDLKLDYQDALKDRDIELQQELLKQQKEVNAQLQKQETARQEMQIGFMKLIKETQEANERQIQEMQRALAAQKEETVRLESQMATQREKWDKERQRHQQEAKDALAAQKRQHANFEHRVAVEYEKWNTERQKEQQALKDALTVQKQETTILERRLAEDDRKRIWEKQREQEDKLDQMQAVLTNIAEDTVYVGTPSNYTQYLREERVLERTDEWTVNPVNGRRLHGPVKVLDRKVKWIADPLEGLPLEGNLFTREQLRIMNMK